MNIKLSNIFYSFLGGDFGAGIFDDKVGVNLDDEVTSGMKSFTFQKTTKAQLGGDNFSP